MNVNMYIHTFFHVICVHMCVYIYVGVCIYICIYKNIFIYCPPPTTIPFFFRAFLLRQPRPLHLGRCLTALRRHAIHGRRGEGFRVCLPTPSPLARRVHQEWEYVDMVMI